MTTLKNSIALAVTLCVLLFHSCKKSEVQTDKPELPKEKQQVSLTYSKEIEPDTAFLNVSNGVIDEYLFLAGGETTSRGSSRLRIYNQKTGEWSFVNLGGKRTRSAMTTLGKKVFIAGGEATKAEMFTIQIYDLTTTKLSVVEFPDIELYGHIALAATVEDRYAVFVNHGRYFHIYDQLKDTWETVDIPYQNRFQMLGMTAVGKKLYFNSGDMPQLRVFDLENKTWSSLKSPDLGRNFQLEVLDHKIYFCGQPVIDVLDTKDGQWSTLELAIPRAAYVTTLDQRAKSFIFSGGHADKPEVIENPGLMSKDVVVYNTESKTWTNYRMRYSRCLQTTRVVNDQLVIYGGASEYNQYPESKLNTEIFNLNYTSITSK